jgi:hypothetical protein
LQWAWPTEALGLARLMGSAHLAFSAHSKSRGNFSPPTQWRRPSIPVVAGDEVAEAGARVRWQGGEPNLGTGEYRLSL